MTIKPFVSLIAKYFFCSYGHLPVITGDFYGIIHSINGVLLVLITDFYDHNCGSSGFGD